MDFQTEDHYTPLVSRVLNIDNVTWGGKNQNFIVRYRGKLYNPDSAAAYDELAASLRPLNVTALFRVEEGQHAVILLPGIHQPRPSKVWVNIVLFGLTLITMLMAGVLYSYRGPAPENLHALLIGVLSNLGSGAAFALTLLGILLTHELGHYLAGRYHKTAVTLPYFLPFPYSLFGTMGAFIQLKEPPKNRRILLAIGIAGPLAGLAVAIPLLIVGLYLSPVEALPFDISAAQGFEGNSILYLALKYLVKGELLPQPFNYFGVNPVWYWLRFYLTSTPLPIGGQDVMLHPIAWASWAGLLVTAINLIPVGQLDGGHILYVLVGRKATYALPLIIAALITLGQFWNGWFVWGFLLLIMGFFHAEPLDLITPLDRSHKTLAILGLIIFVLVFVPVPLY